MESTTLIIALLVALVGLAAGFFIGRARAQAAITDHEGTGRQRAEKLVADAQTRAADLQARAEQLSQEKIVRAEQQIADRQQTSKDKFSRLKAETEEDVKSRKASVVAAEEKLYQQEQFVARQLEQTTRQLEAVTRRETELDELKLTLQTRADKQQTDFQVRHDKQLAKLEDQQKELDAALQATAEERASINGQLETIAQLTAEQAREQLIDNIRQEAEMQATTFVRDT